MKGAPSGTRVRGDRPPRLSSAAALARLEAVLAGAMTAPDPVAALRLSAEDRALPRAVRRALLAADADGVRMAALLVARLRFERLLRGCPEAEAWFDEDPAGFSAAFRRYHAEVPPTAFFPPGEARLFSQWRAASDGRTSKAPRRRAARPEVV